MKSNNLQFSNKNKAYSQIKTAQTPQKAML